MLAWVVGGEVGIEREADMFRLVVDAYVDGRVAVEVSRADLQAIRDMIHEALRAHPRD